MTSEKNTSAREWRECPRIKKVSAPARFPFAWIRAIRGPFFQLWNLPCIAAAVFLFLNACAFAVAPANEGGGQKRPNIIVLLCDDLGYGDVQCLNPERGKIPTPHLDALAKSGMIFTDAHSASAVCTPTRYGLMTGRYPWRTTLQKGVVQGFAPALIAADRPTVASFLKSQGYHTAILGKWHLNFH